MTDVSVMSRILQRCRGGHPLAPEDSELIAYAIEARMRREVRTLDEALEMGPDWPNPRSIAERDAALLKLIDATPLKSGRKRATAILGELQRYAASGFWPDAEQSELPGGRKGLLFAVLRANGGAAPGSTTIRNLISSPARRGTLNR